MNIQPFTVAVPEEVLTDLRDRLARTRWPDEVEEAGWDYGVPLAYMREIVEYWQSEFNWRTQEQRINSFANYLAEIGGMDIHFIHVRGRGPDPVPLILTHGWPSTFYEMLDLIPLLTDPASHGGDPADAFDAVVPSVPGYGFSSKPQQPGFNYRQVADLWVRLMDSLGYARFGAHSYDIGASITTLLLRSYPDRVVGYHTTEATNPAPYRGPDPPDLTDAERAHLDYARAWQADEGGYMAIQTTRPQTLGYGLNDSPAGMAAWIIEKWHAWTDPPSGSLDEHFTKDQLLTNLTIFWVTATMNSANRLYYERAHHPTPMGPGEHINVPVGVTVTTQRIERAPREYIERIFPDIRHWAELPRGGHFIALEEPRLVAENIRALFRELR